MSFFSTLAKIGLGVAAPFTGGATAAAIPLVDAIGGASGSAGSVLGGQQAGTNNARVSQGQLNAQHDRNAVDLYQAQQQAQNQAGLTDLDRQKFLQGNRSETAKQALIGALLGGGVAPTSIGPGGASGGLFRALASNPDALAAMKTLGSQGSQAQHTPVTFTGGNILPAPSLMPVPQIDAGDGKMGNLAKVLQVLGATTPFLSALLHRDDNGGGGIVPMGEDYYGGVGGNG